MKRIKLKDRILPDYTRGEEIFNMVSHIVGGGFGVIALVTCVIKAFIAFDAYRIVSAFIYGFSMVALYTMSSIYHGLKPEKAKKVMQVIDHCTIFFLISGTYTPISLVALRRESPPLGWIIFGVVWGFSILGITLNAIDLKKYTVFSIICYIVLGWCIVFPFKTAFRAIGTPGFYWLLAGGVSYTLGSVLYGIASKKVHCYMHSVFHIFVVLGSILQYICVLFYVL
ncbi:MAG: hemolysin III family protein [Clostridia bacterium]|nr:hemolysin III family protein [Clostridia bacterium]